MNLQEFKEHVDRLDWKTIWFVTDSHGTSRLFSMKPDMSATGWDMPNNSGLNEKISVLIGYEAPNIPWKQSITRLR